MDFTQSTASDCVLPSEQMDLKDEHAQADPDEFHVPAIDILDPRGDLKLRNGNYLFLVSSHVLMLSCRYFEKMLQADTFAESQAQPNAKEPPTKLLADDDPVSFGIMCKLLHFRDVSPPENVEKLGAIADVCDYYGSERAISVYVRVWIHSFEQPERQLTVKELQELLWVAYTFHLEHSFEVFSIRLAAMLNMKAVNALDLSSMPETVQVDMYQLHQNIQRHIRCQVENAINDLRRNKQQHKCTKYLLCNGCFQRKPVETKKCGACGCRDVSQELCQHPLRLTLFFDWLEACRLWPMTRQERLSCQNLIQAIDDCVLPSLLQTSWAHSCDAEEHCPYETAKRAIIESVQRAPQNVKGLRLPDYRIPHK